MQKVIMDVFWRLFVSHPWDWLMSEDGFLSFLEQYGFPTMSPYTEEERLERL